MATHETARFHRSSSGSGRAFIKKPWSKAFFSAKFPAHVGLLGVFLLGGCTATNVEDTRAATSKDRGSENVASCSNEQDLRLVNGTILTMNESNAVVSNIRVQNGRIVALGEEALSLGPKSDCVQEIDLGGRTVIPGLIDSHIHFVRAGIAPGHDLRAAETLTSIAEFQALIADQTKMLPDNTVITIMGGITPTQFDEGRLPTIAELDEVAPNHVVYIQLGFAGPGLTNSAGKAFFSAKGIEADVDGRFAKGPATGRAFGALKSMQTHQDRKEGIRRLMHHANSLGLTTVFDQGGVPFPGAGFFSNEHDYAALTDIWRDKEMTMRMRAQFVVYDGNEKPGAVEKTLQAQETWHSKGDDMLKFTALGEHIVSFPKEGHVQPFYVEKAAAVAAQGWTHEQHSTSFRENKQHIEAIKAIHAKTPITDLRWSLSHVFELGHEKSASLIDTLKSMGMGVRVQNHAYTNPTDRFPLGRTLGGGNAGPLYRTLMDSGIKMGAGSDGALLGPMNPWLSIYYMVTGKNAAGELVNKGQTLSRLEALRLYTNENAWFSFDEQQLGSLEVGKLADLAVLNNDYLTVAEKDIRNLKSVFTLVGGKVVYQDGTIETPVTIHSVPRITN